tara:strand:+ start:409 stop:798 length:390 start_codon:yes stop_codon:yes gene_type:complete
MRITHPPSGDALPVDPDHFTGAATISRLDGISTDPQINVYRVSFEARARTAWHIHSGIQILLIIEGTCRMQSAGKAIQEIKEGGAIRITAGEKHWHGASNDESMIHLAININASTTWLDSVKDEEYDFI